VATPELGTLAGPLPTWEALLDALQRITLKQAGGLVVVNSAGELDGHNWRPVSSCGSFPQPLMANRVVSGPQLRSGRARLRPRPASSAGRPSSAERLHACGALARSGILPSPHSQKPGQRGAAGQAEGAEAGRALAEAADEAKGLPVQWQSPRGRASSLWRSARPQPEAVAASPPGSLPALPAAGPDSGGLVTIEPGPGRW